MVYCALARAAGTGAGATKCESEAEHKPDTVLANLIDAYFGVPSPSV